jgi:hypothetical protein
MPRKLFWLQHVPKALLPECVALFRFDLDRPWDMDAYLTGHIQDSLWTVASALDMTIRECLGDPQDQSLVARTIEKNVWNSTLKLSFALGAQPLKVEFDDRLHRKVPMALGNLFQGRWKVAGVYDPSAKRFNERPEIVQWPKTGKATPRDWLSCDVGHEISTPAQGLPQCTVCPEGTFSPGGAATACRQCLPGTKSHSQHRKCSHVIQCLTAVLFSFDCRRTLQVSSRPRRGKLAALAATASATTSRIQRPRQIALPAHRARKDILESLRLRTEARASARQVCGHLSLLCTLSESQDPAQDTTTRTGRPERCVSPLRHWGGRAL